MFITIYPNIPIILNSFKSVLNLDMLINGLYGYFVIITYRNNESILHSSVHSFTLFRLYMQNGMILQYRYRYRYMYVLIIYKIQVKLQVKVQVHVGYKFGTGTCTC